VEFAQYEPDVEAPHNKQLQRTVELNRGRAASASFHYALGGVQRAAAELRLMRLW